MTKLSSVAVSIISLFYFSVSWRRNAAFIVFNITYLLFLNGVFLVDIVDIGVFKANLYSNLSHGNGSYTAMLMLLSLYSISVAYTAAPFLNRTDNFAASNGQPNIDLPYYHQIQRLTEKLIFVVLAPYLAIMLERIIFVYSSGYEEFYVSYYSRLPLIVSRVGSLYEPLLFLYLATFPSRRKTQLHLALYLSLSSLSLGFGQRNGFILAILFTFIYLASRDCITPTSKKWITGKAALSGVLLSPLIFGLLSAFSFLRSNNKIEANSFLELIPRFFVSQGASINTLAQTIENSFLFPENKFYAFGPVISFFKENIISTYLFNLERYPAASPELAVEGSNFSFAFAYITNPVYYSRGGGYGSNFIAELWIDFGLFGVIIGSLAYGAILASFLSWLGRGKPFATAFAFSAIMSIIYAPRSVFLGFAEPFLSVPTVVAYLTLHMMAREASLRELRNGS